MNYFHKQRLSFDKNGEKNTTIQENDISTNKYKNRAYNFIGIICTLGPSTYDFKILKSLIVNSVNTICIDMSSEDKNFHYGIIKKIREIEFNARGTNKWRPLINIALQIRGKEIRTGLINDKYKNDSLKLLRNHLIELTTNHDYYKNGNENVIFVNYESIVNIVKPGNRVIIGEDIEYRIVLIVDEVLQQGLICIVKTPNILRSYQKVYLPGVRNHMPDITQETIDDLNFAKHAKIHIILTSYICCSDTIHQIRKILRNDNKNTEQSYTILAKISNLESLENLDDIISEADGIVISRDELGIEIPKQKMFLAQKYIFMKCNTEGKICICSSQILNSMRKNPFPIPTESADIRNTIIDGVDCLMLTFETSIGKYPVEACETIRRISIETRLSIIHDKIYHSIILKNIQPKNETESIALAAINIAIQCNAACIIAITITGRSATALVKCNPPCPIIAVTEEISIARQLFLHRGVWPIWPQIAILHHHNKESWMNSIENSVEHGIKFGKEMDIVHNGDCMVVTSGWGIESRSMNTMRVIYAYIPDDEIKIKNSVELK